MNKKLIHSLFFIVLLLFLALLATNLTFDYGKQIEDIDPQIEWQFFHEQLIHPSTAKEVFHKGETITLPHKFSEHYDTAKTYGTYIAKLTLPMSYVNEKIGLFIPFQYGNYNVYIQNELVLSKGDVSTTPNVLHMGPGIGDFTSTQREVYITLQLSNFSSMRGGFAQPLQVGEYESLLAKHYTTITCYFFIISLIFMLGIFLLRFSLLTKTNKSSYLLAAICITFAIRAIFARPFFYSLTLIDIPWEYAVRIEAFTTLLIMLLFIMFCQELLSHYIRPVHLSLAYGSVVCQSMLVIMASPMLFQQTFMYCFIIYIAHIPYCLYIIVKHYRQLDTTKKLQILGILCLAIATIHDVFIVYQVRNQMMLIHFMLIAYALLQIMIVTKKYEDTLKHVLQLNEQVTALNVSLEQKVEERTQELVILNQKLELLASKDSLTGIANRYIFDRSLTYYFKETHKPQHALTLFMIDLDYFKQYNDTYGHQAGDELLVKIVETLQRVIPSDALFARYGGEEFAILSDDIHLDYERLGNALLHAVEKEEFTHMHCSKGIATISVGAYHIRFGHDFKQPEDLIIAADKQLYKAKHNGKNQFRFSID